MPLEIAQAIRDSLGFLQGASVVIILLLVIIAYRQR